MRGNNSERVVDGDEVSQKPRQPPKSGVKVNGGQEIAEGSRSTGRRVTRPQRRQPKLTNIATDFKTSQLAAINCWAAWEEGREGKWAGQRSRCAAPKHSFHFTVFNSVLLSPSLPLSLFICLFAGFASRLFVCFWCWWMLPQLLLLFLILLFFYGCCCCCW